MLEKVTIPNISAAKNSGENVSAEIQKNSPKFFPPKFFVFNV